MWSDIKSTEIIMIIIMIIMIIIVISSQYKPAVLFPRVGIRD